jgi:hypothetical protein
MPCWAALGSAFSNCFDATLGRKAQRRAMPQHYVTSRKYHGDCVFCKLIRNPDEGIVHEVRVRCVRGVCGVCVRVCVMYACIAGSILRGCPRQA